MLSPWTHNADILRRLTIWINIGMKYKDNSDNMITRTHRQYVNATPLNQFESEKNLVHHRPYFASSCGSGTSVWDRFVVIQIALYDIGALGDFWWLLQLLLQTLDFSIQ